MSGSEAPTSWEFSLVSVAPSDEVARLLVTEFLAEVDRILPGGFDPSHSVPAPDEELRPPLGDFLVCVDRQGEPLGCGALRREAPRVFEIKRMWVRPPARGRGLGRVILEGLERRAVELGATEVVLDTSEYLPAALALYRSAGYKEIPAYNDNPYASHWFKKEIGPATDIGATRG
jgi:GNAT superfamily N-acetyltransferase